MTDKKCPMCKGTMTLGMTELTFKRDRSVVVVQGVPALVCQDCGEALLDAEISETVYEIALREIKRGVSLEFCTYAA